MDGGIAWQYNPQTQTFSGMGLNTGPLTLSMQEMMQKATPNTGLLGDSVYNGPTITPITNFNAPNVDTFPAPISQPGIGSTQPLGSTTMQPQAMVSTQFSQPFSASNIYQQLQGTNTPQTFQPFNYSNVYQQPNLYNQFSNPFAMQPFFNQLGLTNIAGAKF